MTPAELGGGRGTLKTERKHVTVVFSDLSGFTALSERLDPEDIHSLLARLFGEIAQVVTSYEGHIDRFVGDAAMALFGLPVAHEDDAVRAVMAAREIVRRAEHIIVTDSAGERVPLHIHAGVASGLVVAGEVGPAHDGGTVLGDTVNVASRLTAVAHSDQIVTDGQTYALACGRFDFEPLGELHVRGRTEPVEAYRVLHPRADPVTVHRLVGLRAPLVGRDQELERLEAAAKRVQRGGRVFVGVSGTPGCGKSRLVDEFRHGPIGSQLEWHEAHCFSYGVDVPYGVITDMICQELGLDRSDSAALVRTRLGAAIARAGMSDPRALARLERLFGIDDPVLAGVDPESWRAAVFDDIGSLFANTCARGPTALLVEDVHWGDTASLECLAAVLACVDAPLLVVMTYRAPFDVQDLAVALPDAAVEEIGLRELDADEAVEMTLALLGCSAIPPELDEFVRTQMGGNPFFIEESVNALVASGRLRIVDTVCRLQGQLRAGSVPQSVASVVSARLDRLDERTRRIAAEAAVIGRVVPVELLRDVTAHAEHVDRALGELARLDIMERLSDDRDADWQFRHVLTQEAIVEQLVTSERRVIDERVARSIERLYAERLPEFYETIAYHYAIADARDEAVRYLCASADKAMMRYAVAAAHRYLRDAYGIVRRGADHRSETVDVVLRLAEACYFLGAFNEIEALLLTHYADALGEPAQVLARYELWLGIVFWHRQKISRSRNHLVRALDLAEQSNESALAALAHAELGYALSDLGELDKAVGHADKACAAARELEGDAFLWEEAFGSAGYAHWCTGRSVEAVDAGTELLEYGLRHDNRRCVAFGRWTRALGYLDDAQFDAALAEADEASRVSTDPWIVQFPKFFIAICSVWRGDYEHAIEPLREIIEYGAEGGAETLAVPSRALLGAALAGVGRLDEGIAMLEAGRGQMRDDHRFWAQLNAVYILGVLHARIAEGEGEADLRILLHNLDFVVHRALKAGRLAQRYLHEAIDLAEAMGAHGMAGDCWHELAQLEMSRGERAHAAAAYEQAACAYRRCGETNQLDLLDIERRAVRTSAGI